MIDILRESALLNGYLSYYKDTIRTKRFENRFYSLINDVVEVLSRAL